MRAAPAVTVLSPRAEALRRNAVPSPVEPAMPHAEPAARLTMDDLHAQIEAADDVPTSMKFILLQNEARHRDTMDAIRDGFGRQADATKEQTDTWIAFAKRAGIVGGLGAAALFALVVFAMSGFMYLAKVDLEAATKSTQGVTGAASGLAAPAPDVAPSGG